MPEPRPQIPEGLKQELLQSRAEPRSREKDQVQTVSSINHHRHPQRRRLAARLSKRMTREIKSEAAKANDEDKQGSPTTDCASPAYFAMKYCLC